MTTIKLSDEAKKAIKSKGPSDKRLTRILNEISESTMPSSREARWMAAQILGNYGYKLEA